MPNRTKKNPKRSNQSEGSHWQNFHFSGKLIVCSVIFGLMLLLIGGIVYAIGMDRDDDTKSDDYEDLQKKPPMAIVGPVIMGIGGFIVIVGVFMCLVETNVFHRNNVENRSLIEHDDRVRDSAAIGIESEPTAVPSTSHRHRNGNSRKHPSPRKTRNGKKINSTKDTSPRTPASVPISVIGHNSKQFLSASDKFLTPPSSFTDDMHPNSRDAENQTSSSLMKSFMSSGNSWTVSAEFQTPNASSIENSMSVEASRNERFKNTLDPNLLLINSHEFLTPKNSVYPDMLISSVPNPNNHIEIISNVEVSNGVSECGYSSISDQTKVEIENTYVNSDILEEANKQMNSDILDKANKQMNRNILDKVNAQMNSVVLDEASVTSELEDTNLNTEFHSPSLPLNCTEETLPIGEKGGGNKYHVDISEVTPNSDKAMENKKNSIELSSNIPLDLATEIKEIANESANTGINQDNSGSEKMNICVEDNSKSFDIKEAISKESEHTVIETDVEYSRNQSDTIKAETADISQQENVCIEIDQILIDCESTDNNSNSAS